MLSIFATARDAAAHGSASPLSCAERSVSAGAVRGPQDVPAFVQCAYEYVQQNSWVLTTRSGHSMRTRGEIAVRSMSSSPE